MTEVNDNEIKFNANRKYHSSFRTIPKKTPGIPEKDGKKKEDKEDEEIAYFPSKAKRSVSDDDEVKKSKSFVEVKKTNIMKSDGFNKAMGSGIKPNSSCKSFGSFVNKSKIMRTASFNVIIQENIDTKRKIQKKNSQSELRKISNEEIIKKKSNFPKKPFFNKSQKPYFPNSKPKASFKYYISTIKEIFSHHQAPPAKTLKNKWYFVSKNNNHPKKNENKKSEVQKIIFEEHFLHTFSSMRYFLENHEMVYGGKIMGIEFPSTCKPTLVIDLDETMIHSIEGDCDDAHLKILYPSDKGNIPISVFIRPGLSEFLERVSSVYDIIVFTASNQNYADSILDMINSPYLNQRIYRPHCTFAEDQIFIKDLRVIEGREMGSILLVDNASYSYVFQINNGVPIVPFYDDPKDSQLPKLADYLLNLANSAGGCYEKLAEMNGEFFKFKKMAECSSIDEVLSKLY